MTTTHNKLPIKNLSRGQLEGPGVKLALKQLLSAHNRMTPRTGITTTTPTPFALSITHSFALQPELTPNKQTPSLTPNHLVVTSWHPPPQSTYKRVWLGLEGPEEDTMLYRNLGQQRGVQGPTWPPTAGRAL
jgi:hypothetical protein